MVRKQASMPLKEPDWNDFNKSLPQYYAAMSTQPEREQLAMLEQMFKGVGRFDHGDFVLRDSSGMPFYTDNENPYVDIRLYPTDNWSEVIAGYVRKTAQPGIFEAKRLQTGK